MQVPSQHPDRARSDQSAIPTYGSTESSPRSWLPIFRNMTTNSSQSHPFEVDAATLFTSTLVPSRFTTLTPLSLSPPSTPPPPIRSSLSCATHSLPPLTKGHCTIHFLLERSLVTPMIEWDVRTPPITAACLQHHPRNGAWWSEPAAIPPQQSVTIRVLEWDTFIVVFPNQPTTPFVTIRDVLDFVFCVGLERAQEHDRVISHWEAPIVRLRQTVGGPPVDSLLFSTAGQAAPPACACNRDRGNGCYLGAKGDGGEPPMSGWRWGGLRASSKEHDVWDLFLE